MDRFEGHRFCRPGPLPWLILTVPIAAVVIFLIVAASVQINQWGLNWIWAVFTLIFVAWRFLLV
ncbi:MAG: hypothetical protein ACKOEQ_03965, partial [Verrucomicrobiota bacterium]